MDSFFRIGGLTLGVRGTDVLVSGPLAKFAVAAGEPDVWIEVTGDPLPHKAPGGNLLFDSGAVWQLFEDGDGYRIDCHSALFGEMPYKTARVTRDLRRVEIRMRVAGLDPLEFPLDELLINALLARR